MTELQQRVARDEEKEDEARKENFGLKQKVQIVFNCPPKVQQLEGNPNDTNKFTYNAKKITVR